MKKIIFIISAAALLALSCTNGSASTLDTQVKDGPDVNLTADVTTGDDQKKGEGTRDIKSLLSTIKKRFYMECEYCYYLHWPWRERQGIRIA